MRILPGQIYLAKNAQLGRASYARPCLVVRIDAVSAVVVYFSTKFDLIEPTNFILDASDPNFDATGLDESSFLISNHGVPVKLNFFDGAKLLGAVSGDLKKRIEDWWGESFDAS